MFFKKKRKKCKESTATSQMCSTSFLWVCRCILLCIIAVGRCESFECHIIKLMAMQAEKLHFKCFSQRTELLNWSYKLWVCVCCKQKYWRERGCERLNCSDGSFWWCCGFLCEMHFPSRLFLYLWVCVLAMVRICFVEDFLTTQHANIEQTAFDYYDMREWERAKSCRIVYSSSNHDTIETNKWSIVDYLKCCK